MKTHTDKRNGWTRHKVSVIGATIMMALFVPTLAGYSHSIGDAMAIGVLLGSMVMNAMRNE
jgi:hypothetical protein